MRGGALKDAFVSQVRVFARFVKDLTKRIMRVPKI